MGPLETCQNTAYLFRSTVISESERANPEQSGGAKQLGPVDLLYGVAKLPKIL